MALILALSEPAIGTNFGFGYLHSKLSTDHSANANAQHPEQSQAGLVQSSRRLNLSETAFQTMTATMGLVDPITELDSRFGANRHTVGCKRRFKQR